MEKAKFYTLPQLPYGYDELQPYVSQEQLTLHHQKHHQAYVNSANAILERLDKARKDLERAFVSHWRASATFIVLDQHSAAGQRRGKANGNFGRSHRKGVR